MEECDFYADVCVGGKIAYLKPLPQEDGYFGGTVGIQTTVKRKGFITAHKTLVKGFLPKKEWDYLMNKGMSVHDYLAVGGQIEEWTDKKGNSKAINIFEEVIKFKKFA